MTDDRIESHEERLLVLRDKAAREGFVIGDDVLDYIAGKYALATTLKGALINVQALASRKGVPVTLSIARLALDGIRESSTAAAEVAAQEAAASEADAEEPDSWDEAAGPTVEAGPDTSVTDTLFAPPAPKPPQEPSIAHVQPSSETRREPAVVWFAPVRSVKKESLVKRVGKLLKAAGIKDVIEEDDLVAVKLHFGEEGNTGFVQPIFLREVVRRVRKRGGKPFLTDATRSTAAARQRGRPPRLRDPQRLRLRDGRRAAHHRRRARRPRRRRRPDQRLQALRDRAHRRGRGARRRDGRRHARQGPRGDRLRRRDQERRHGPGYARAKQRMHGDLKPEVTAEKCTACGRCVKWCPVNAIAIGDKVAVIDYDVCYGCGECVATCPYGAIGIQWKTDPEAIQEKIVEHCAGALAGKEGKVVYLSFVTNVSPDCDCWNFSDAPVVADIGVLASTDLVAIDQAAYDLVQRLRGCRARAARA